MDKNTILQLVNSRKSFPKPGDEYIQLAREQAAEGGCGVIGFASTEQVAGKHMLTALDQMRNRCERTAEDVFPTPFTAQRAVTAQLQREGLERGHGIGAEGVQRLRRADEEPGVHGGVGNGVCRGKAPAGIV